MRKLLALACFALCLPLAGCGQDLLAGGYDEGEASAVLVDDPGEPSSARAPEPSWSRSGAGPSPAEAAALQGTVTATASVELVDESGRVVPLTPGAARGTVRIAATDRAVLGTTDVRAVHYVRARVTFSAVEAEITAGLSLGGAPLQGSVRVRLAETVLVDAPIDLRVEESSRHEVVVDLNASTWIRAADPASGVVAAAAFRQAVRVRVE